MNKKLLDRAPDYHPYLYRAPAWDPQRIARDREITKRMRPFAPTPRCADCKRAARCGQWVDRCTIHFRFLCTACLRLHPEAQLA